MKGHRIKKYAMKRWKKGRARKGNRKEYRNGKKRYSCKILLHARPQTGTRGKVMRAARDAATVARIFISSLLYHPSAPSFFLPSTVTYAPRGLDRFRNSTNKADKNERRAKKDERKRDKENEGEGRSDDRGKWWGTARAIRPLHHLLHRCIEDVAPCFAGTPYVYCMPRRYYRRLRRFYCFKYRTCRA